MTTLVAVRKDDQIAIAADSLTTFGDVRLASHHDRSFDKIVAYRGNYIGLCGSAAHHPDQADRGGAAAATASDCIASGAAQD